MRPCLRFSGASAGTKSRVYLLIAFLFIAEHTTGLYLPDSIWLFKQKASASELCINPDAEFNEGEEAWHQSESLFPVFNRQATSLWKEHLLARSLVRLVAGCERLGRQLGCASAVANFN